MKSGSQIVLPFGYVERTPERGQWISAFEAPPPCERVQILYDDGVIGFATWSGEGWQSLSRNLQPIAWRRA